MCNFRSVFCIALILVMVFPSLVSAQVYDYAESNYKIYTTNSNEVNAHELSIPFQVTSGDEYITSVKVEYYIDIPNSDKLYLNWSSHGNSQYGSYNLSQGFSSYAKYSSTVQFNSSQDCSYIELDLANGNSTNIRWAYISQVVTNLNTYKFGAPSGFDTGSGGTGSGGTGSGGTGGTNNIPVQVYSTPDKPIYIVTPDGQSISVNNVDIPDWLFPPDPPDIPDVEPPAQWGWVPGFDSAVPYTPPVSDGAIQVSKPSILIPEEQPEPDALPSITPDFNLPDREDSMPSEPVLNKEPSGTRESVPVKDSVPFKEVMQREDVPSIENYEREDVPIKETYSRDDVYSKEDTLFREPVLTREPIP